MNTTLCKKGYVFYVLLIYLWTFNVVVGGHSTYVHLLCLVWLIVQNLARTKRRTSSLVVTRCVLSFVFHYAAFYNCWTSSYGGSSLVTKELLQQLELSIVLKDLLDGIPRRSRRRRNASR